MLYRTASAACDRDLIGLMDPVIRGGIVTLGGAAHGVHDLGVGGSDRVAGVSPVVMNNSSGRRSGTEGRAELGVASLSGAAARSERPEAMLARGSRVTGSGGAGFRSTSATEPTLPAGSQAFASSSGETVSFVDLADLRAERFL